MESSQVHTDARNVRARSCQRNELPSTMLRILARTRPTGAGFRSKTSPIAISSRAERKMNRSVVTSANTFYHPPPVSRQTSL